jgi:RNA polymerase sigma-70 factor (ECF subfamily)
MPLSDAEILEQFGREKTRNAAFAHLVEKYQQKIYWLVRRMVVSHDDADDLVQEIFIKVWNNLDRFRQDAQLYSWMYRIASNECLQFLQKKKKQNTTSFDELTENTADSFGTSDGFSGDQIQQKLYRAIETLPEKQKLIFQMKYFEEMKYEEISSVLGTSVGALKASFHLAVKKIEQQLVQHD